MFRRFSLLCAWVFFVGGLFGAPTQPTIPATSFDVTAHQVVGDGKTDNTAALQKLFDEVSAAGGGRVIFPASDKPYLAGPLKLRSKLELHLMKGATLSPLPFG